MKMLVCSWMTESSTVTPWTSQLQQSSELWAYFFDTKLLFRVHYLLFLIYIHFRQVDHMFTRSWSGFGWIFPPPQCVRSAFICTASGTGGRWTLSFFFFFYWTVQDRTKAGVRKEPGLWNQTSTGGTCFFFSSLSDLRTRKRRGFRRA